MPLSASPGPVRPATSRRTRREIRRYCHLIVTFTRTSTRKMVELRGFEPLTFCMPCRRATSCAIAPHARRWRALSWGRSSQRRRGSLAPAPLRLGKDLTVHCPAHALHPPRSNARSYGWPSRRVGAGGSRPGWVSEPRVTRQSPAPRGATLPDSLRLLNDGEAEAGTDDLFLELAGGGTGQGCGELDPDGALEVG
jgi:hypothetical protein